MNMKWKNMTFMEKVCFIFTCIAVVFVVIAILKPDLFSENIIFPAIAVVSVAEAVPYWKKNRRWAYLLIAGAVICMTCFLLELFLI